MEGELFKVPRLYFENESSIFKDMFQIPSLESREGTNDDLSITLESIKKADFAALLAAMFPEQVPILVGCRFMLIPLLA